MRLAKPAEIVSTAGRVSFVVGKDEDDLLAVQIYEPLEKEEAVQTHQSSEGTLSSSLPSGDLLFVTWIAFGDYGDGGLKAHNFHNVDMR